MVTRLEVLRRKEVLDDLEAVLLNLPSHDERTETDKVTARQVVEQLRALLTRWESDP